MHAQSSEHVCWGLTPSSALLQRGASALLRSRAKLSVPLPSPHGQSMCAGYHHALDECTSQAVVMQLAGGCLAGIHTTRLWHVAALRLHAEREGSECTLSDHTVLGIVLRQQQKFLPFSPNWKGEEVLMS